MIARGTLRAGSRTRLVATAALSMPRNEKSSRADALGSAVHEPPCARTGPTLPGWNASNPATATIARAVIFRTVVATATAPTDRVPTRLLSAASQSRARGHGEGRQPTRPEPERRLRVA